MAYRVYLRTFNGRMSENTITTDKAVAKEAFAELVEREDLDGKKLAAVLTHDNGQLALHRFDRASGINDWRGKIDEIPWPQAGRPSEMEGGKRVNVYLDAASLDTASRLGDGNVSNGIRIALKIAA